MIAISTGMRRGEILGLTWENVDLNNFTITVKQALYPTKNGLVILPPKTKTSMRKLSIPQTLVNILKTHKEQYNNKGKFVCCSENGEIISPSSLNHKFKNLLSENDLPSIRFHDLRHSHASLLLSQGVQAKVISERLGHSNINITLDLYSHVYEATNIKVANDFDQFLRV